MRLQRPGQYSVGLPGIVESGGKRTHADDERRNAYTSERVPNKILVSSSHQSCAWLVVLVVGRLWHPRLDASVKILGQGREGGMP